MCWFHCVLNFSKKLSLVPEDFCEKMDDDVENSIHAQGKNCSQLEGIFSEASGIQLHQTL